MKKYLPYVKKYWYSFLLGPLFMVIEACGEFILPYINARIINVGAANHDIPFIIENGLYMLAIAVIMLVAGVLGANFAIRGASRLAFCLRRDVFHKIQSFSFADIDSFTTGSLITRITNDVTQVQNFTQNLLRGMFRSPVMLIGAVIMSFKLNPNLARVLLVVVPFLAAAITLIVKVSAPRYIKMQKQLDELNTNIKETVTNERVIKSFVREEHEIEKFKKVNRDLMDKCISAIKVMMLLLPVSAFTVNATTVAIVWFAGRQIMTGSMEIGTLTAFITYLTQVLMSLNFLAMIILSGVRAGASDKRISEVLNTEPDLNDDNAEGENTVNSGSIELKNVSFKYFKTGKEKVLDGVSLSIKSGELVGIIGSTGSGKTTLISLIPRLYDPDTGEVLVDGKNVKSIPLFNLRESVSVVLQKNTLFSGTIAENIRWGNENATDEELKAAAETAQAHGFISAMAKGYETELGQGGVNLSGGQKQRLCIARALLKKPKILILDDSTSAVDTATDASIRKAFRETMPSVTKLIISQRINSVKDADKIVVLDKGKIVGCGQHACLMENCLPYREIYFSQNDPGEAK